MSNFESNLKLNGPVVMFHATDVLNQALMDVLREFGLGETDGALVLLHFDVFVKRSSKAAHRLLDVIADASYEALTYQQVMLVLVQSDNPRLVLEPVGARSIGWNDLEWTDKSRNS